MKTFLKILLISVLSIILIVTALVIFINEEKPKGISTSRADELALSMLEKVNAEDWENTKLIQFTFMGLHDYVWDKERNFVQVSWSNHRVLIDTKDLSRTLVYTDNKLVTGSEKQSLADDAWAYFCNDSFWICAHTKLFDPGTTRYLVEGSSMNELMVEYSSGGVTPGDIYVWELDENDFPIAFKMWVSIIPIGGIRASWDDMSKSATGAMIPNSHSIGFVKMSVTNLVTANLWKDFPAADPFESLS